MTGNSKKGGEKSPPTAFPELSDEWAAKEQKIIAAFKKLPGVNEIGFEDGFAPIVRHIMLMVPPPKNPVIEKYTRRFNVVSPAVTRKEVDKVKAAAIKLRDTLECLHSPAIQALNLTLVQFVQLEERIRILAAQAEQAEIPDTPANAGRGRKRRTRLKDFSKSIAEHYYFVTGREPTRRADWDSGTPYGPFIELLAEMFKIFGIKANADAEAREAIKSMEINWQKTDD